MSFGLEPTFLHRLKAATRAEHDAIDEALDLVGPSLTLAVYRQHVARFHSFYALLEEELFGTQAWPAHTLDPQPRRKLAWLQADLQALGLDAADTPRCNSTQLPDLPSRGHRFGCLYVLEGSTLGGQLIGRHLQLALGITPENGGRFFSGYGPRTGAMWMDFRAALAAFATEPGCQAEVIAGAIDTFGTLRAWCSQETFA